MLNYKITVVILRSLEKWRKYQMLNHGKQFRVNYPLTEGVVSFLIPQATSRLFHTHSRSHLAKLHSYLSCEFTVLINFEKFNCHYEYGMFSQKPEIKQRHKPDNNTQHNLAYIPYKGKGTTKTTNGREAEI